MHLNSGCTVQRFPHSFSFDIELVNISSHVCIKLIWLFLKRINFIVSSSEYICLSSFLCVWLFTGYGIVEITRVRVCGYELKGFIVLVSHLVSVLSTWIRVYMLLLVTVHREVISWFVLTAFRLFLLKNKISQVYTACSTLGVHLVGVK